MAATSIAIADGLVAWLNDPGQDPWPVTGWAAERVWAPARDLKALDDKPLVEVVPSGILPAEDETRCTESQPYGTAVMVRQRYPDAGDLPRDWVDARAELAEAICVRVRNVKLATAGQLLYCEVATADLIDPDDLTVRRVAASVVETLWREFR